MSSNYQLQTDLNEAKAMVSALEEYVRGTELYGHANGGFFTSMPSLTVGAVLMRLRRLDLLRSSMKDSQSKELDKKILSSLKEKSFLEAAAEIQKALTDDIIAKAFHK